MTIYKRINALDRDNLIASSSVGALICITIHLLNIGLQPLELAPIGLLFPISYMVVSAIRTQLSKNRILSQDQKDMISFVNQSVKDKTYTVHTNKIMKDWVCIDFVVDQSEVTVEARKESNFETTSIFIKPKGAAKEENEPQLLSYQLDQVLTKIFEQEYRILIEKDNASAEEESNAKSSLIRSMLSPVGKKSNLVDQMNKAFGK